jgi:hypothetical protein
MAFTRKEIENAILESTGRPDSGVIRDHLASMVDGVLRLVNPGAAVSDKANKDVRIIKAEETR